MNIDPNIWGPGAWKFMYNITLAYPDNPNPNTKSQTYNFFTSLSAVLPCETCRYNFSQHIQKYPLNNDILSSRDNLINWLIDIHNQVNISTGKPILSYESARHIYQNQSSSSSWANTDLFKNIDRRLMIIIGVFLLIVVILVLLRLRRKMN